MKQLLPALFFLLTIFTVPLCAQDKLRFSIASFEQDPFDLTAQNDAYKKIDGSGFAYAIIKVTSNNPNDNLKAYNFNFGNLRHSVVDRDGELWVYVQKNAKMVTISRTGYNTVNKYDLKMTLESGKTYIMQLSTTGPVVYTQMVQFVVRPSDAGAVIVVKNSTQDATEMMLGTVDTSGELAKSLAYGTYTYKVIATNYHVSEGRFTLKNRTQIHKEEIVLRPNFSRITLQTNANADIFINGEKKGTGSWSGILQAGNYQVECRQEQHRNSSQYLTIGENENRTIDLAPPTPIWGSLAVTSRPLGATIHIDNHDYGVTPKNINEVLIGHHIISLSKQNYKTEIQTIEVHENQTTDVDITLTDMALMTIKSTPSEAKLSINGKEIGYTPYTADMPSGDYDIQLSKSKYRVFKQRVHLDSSNPELTLTLSRQYQQPSAFYLNVGFQAGALMGPKAALGLYLGGFNVEGFFIYGINKSESIFWNYYGKNDNRPCEYQYSATGFGGKLGYGIIVGARLRFTPQAGISIVNFADNDKMAEGYVVSGTAGIRTDIAIANNFGAFITPEYSFAAKKSKVFEQLEPLSSKIKKWANGFNVSLGLCLFF